MKSAFLFLHIFMRVKYCSDHIVRDDRPGLSVFFERYLFCAHFANTLMYSIVVFTVFSNVIFTIHGLSLTIDIKSLYP